MRPFFNPHLPSLCSALRDLADTPPGGPGVGGDLRKSPRSEGSDLARIEGKRVRELFGMFFVRSFSGVVERVHISESNVQRSIKAKVYTMRISYLVVALVGVAAKPDDLDCDDDMDEGTRIHGKSVKVSTSSLWSSIQSIDRER